MDELLEVKKHSECQYDAIFHLALRRDNFNFAILNPKSLGKRNYLITRKILVHESNPEFIASFDEIMMTDLTMDTFFEDLSEFVNKRITDPILARIIYWDDEDIIPSAQLREIFGIPGESMEDGLIFLDKLKTKPYLQKAGVKSAEYYHFYQLKKENFNRTVDLIEEKFKNHYPLFGKPTNLCSSRCTENISNRSELKNYLEFSLRFPHLEFLIETYLEGPHCQQDAIIIDGKIVYDFSWLQPLKCDEIDKTGCIAGIQIPFDSEIYKKGHEAMEKFISVLPHTNNTFLWFEFIFVNGEVFILEASKRPPASPLAAFYYSGLGINLEDMHTRVSIGRMDFKFPERNTYLNNAAFLMYFNENGIVTKANPFPKVNSKITYKFFYTNVGDIFENQDKVNEYKPSCSIHFINEDRSELENELNFMLKWNPFVFSNI